MKSEQSLLFALKSALLVVIGSCIIARFKDTVTQGLSYTGFQKRFLAADGESNETGKVKPVLFEM